MREKRREGVITFQSTDKSIKVTYQKRYHSGWKEQDKNIEDTPDIVVELKNGQIIIIDAKNSRYKTGNPYRYQMQSYMDSANAKLGILIYSAAEKTNLWKEITKNDQKIIQTYLTPEILKVPESNCEKNLKKIILLLDNL